MSRNPALPRWWPAFAKPRFPFTRRGEGRREARNKEKRADPQPKTKTFPLPVIIYEQGSGGWWAHGWLHRRPCTVQCSMPTSSNIHCTFLRHTKYYKYALGTGHVIFGPGKYSKRIETNITKLESDHRFDPLYFPAVDGDDPFSNGLVCKIDIT